MTGDTSTAGATDAVVIERDVDASVEAVWRMWVEADRFASWYGPTGAAVTVHEWDARVGGRRHVGLEMETPNGPMQMWFTGEFLEIAEPERLRYTEALADAEGRELPAAQAGVPDGHPTVTEVAVELTAVGDRTRLLLTHHGIPADSPGAQGWLMALDELDALLAES